MSTKSKTASKTDWNFLAFSASLALIAVTYAVQHLHGALLS
jgi:hypothetical protein